MKKYILIALICCFGYLNFQGYGQTKDSIISTPESRYLSKLLIGQINYTKDTNFVKVNELYSYQTIYLQKSVYAQFIKMAQAARKENIYLKILSGARNFWRQKIIWERKWEQIKIEDSIEKVKNIMTFSSMPMTSRHHWGTEIDLNSLDNSYFTKGEGFKIYSWLCKNASKYGFYQVYTDKNTTQRTGYEMEKWHWSYMPLSQVYLTLYLKQYQDTDIKGFIGSELAVPVKVIKNYVEGITDDYEK